MKMHFFLKKKTIFRKKKTIILFFFFKLSEKNKVVFLDVTSLDVRCLVDFDSFDAFGSDKCATVFKRADGI